MGSTQSTWGVQDLQSQRTQGLARIMKLFLVVPSLLCLVTSSPLPQDPNDEVELINGGPVSTNDGDYDYSGFGGFVPRVRVFLIPAQESENDSSIGDVGGFLGILKSIFAAGQSPTLTETTAVDENKSCFLCELLDETLSDVQGHIDDVRDRENEVDFIEGENGLGINNSTHTKKVLEDGTVLHINKTIIADTDEDGNSFFLHRSVIHNVGEDDQLEGGEEVFETEAEDEDGIDDGLVSG